MDGFSRNLISEHFSKICPEIILTHVPFIFYSFVLWPTNAQLFQKLSHCYMFRQYRFTLRELVVSTLLHYVTISNSTVGNTIYNFNTSTMHLLLFCTMTNQCTIISQIILLLLHVSTLSYHPQGARSYYFSKLQKYDKCSCWQYHLQFHVCL
jgi:hypothetical protein